jgi:hypothetical protein
MRQASPLRGGTLRPPAVCRSRLQGRAISTWGGTARSPGANVGVTSA